MPACGRDTAATCHPTPPAANSSLAATPPATSIHPPPATHPTPPAPPQVSTTVLRRVVRALPGLRDKLVGAFAAFVVRIQVRLTIISPQAHAALHREPSFVRTAGSPSFRWWRALEQLPPPGLAVGWSSWLLAPALLPEPNTMFVCVCVCVCEQEDYPEVIKDSLLLLLRCVRMCVGRCVGASCWLGVGVRWRQLAPAAVSGAAISAELPAHRRRLSPPHPADPPSWPTPHALPPAAACCGSGWGWRCRSGRRRRQAGRRLLSRPLTAWRGWRGRRWCCCAPQMWRWVGGWVGGAGCGLVGGAGGGVCGWRMGTGGLENAGGGEARRSPGCWLPACLPARLPNARLLPACPPAPLPPPALPGSAARRGAHAYRPGPAPHSGQPPPAQQQARHHAPLGGRRGARLAPRKPAVWGRRGVGPAGHLGPRLRVAAAGGQSAHHARRQPQAGVCR